MATNNLTATQGEPQSQPEGGISLDRLAPDVCGTVSRIDTDDQDGQRLKAMGVCLGRKVELVQGGDPLILRVLGSRIGLSARLARRVWVQTCAAPECQPVTGKPVAG
jgi:Fe2+ transport system protein FeoA